MAHQNGIGWIWKILNIFRNSHLKTFFFLSRAMTLQPCRWPLYPRPNGGLQHTILTIVGRAETKTESLAFTVQICNLKQSEQHSPRKGKTNNNLFKNILWNFKEKNPSTNLCKKPYNNCSCVALLPIIGIQIRAGHCNKRTQSELTFCLSIRFNGTWSGRREIWTVKRSPLLSLQILLGRTCHSRI